MADELVACLARRRISVSRASSSKRAVREADAEVVGGDVFELVGLVEDDGAGVGEDAGVGGSAGLLLDGEVGEEEVVVDDDEVGLERLAAHVGDEAALPVGAGLAEAGFGAGVELVPERGVLGELIDLGAVAGFGRALPVGDVVRTARSRRDH